MEAVRAFYERYNRGDIDGAMELFAPDAQLNNCVLGQIFDGNAAIRGFLDEYADIVEDPKAEPGELTEDDDLIIVPVEPARPPEAHGHHRGHPADGAGARLPAPRREARVVRDLREHPRGPVSGGPSRVSLT